MLSRMLLLLLSLVAVMYNMEKRRSSDTWSLFEQHVTLFLHLDVEINDITMWPYCSKPDHDNPVCLGYYNDCEETVNVSACGSQVGCWKKSTKLSVGKSESSEFLCH